MRGTCHSVYLWNIEEDEHLIRSQYLYSRKTVRHDFYLLLEITFREIILCIKFKFDKYISDVLKLLSKRLLG